MTYLERFRFGTLAIDDSQRLPTTLDDFGRRDHITAARPVDQRDAVDRCQHFVGEVSQVSEAGGACGFMRLLVMYLLTIT